MEDSEFSLPSGFRFSGVACGIKASGKPDVSLIVTDRPATAAGVYTRNQVVAAPVVLSRSKTPSATIRAVVANSGNANACTGAPGAADAESMCRQVATLVGCDPRDVLVMSTGVIGRPLPMDRVASGIDQAFESLGEETTHFLAAADAICTTDQYRKVAHRNLTLSGKSIQIVGMAKGAGMIAPNMATMLATILTDAPLSPDSAQLILSEAADASFNRVTVDGHTSTNDTCLLLSSGSGEPLAGSDLRQLDDAVKEIALELAKLLVADGEGARHYFEIAVSGAEDDASAETIARAIADSPLVKTAITGGDPNWGRFVSAAGYTSATIEPEHVALKIAGVEIYAAGSPLPFNVGEVRKRMRAEREVKVEITVGTGKGSAVRWASDLTTHYVTFNAEYTT